MKGGIFNAANFHRIGVWLVEKKIPVLPRLTEIIIYILFNSTLPLTAKIGKGTYCSHRGMSVVLHRQCSIGKDCIIGTCVTLGGRHEDDPGGPLVGDRVYIGTGAKVLGPINIGYGAKIGANSVVLIDVPAGATAIGVPAKIINVK